MFTIHVYKSVTVVQIQHYTISGIQTFIWTKLLEHLYEHLLEHLYRPKFYLQHFLNEINYSRPLK